MQIKIFNIVTQIIYLVVFNKFVYQNQFVIEIDSHIKFIEKNKRKKILCNAEHIKNLIKHK